MGNVSNDSTEDTSKTTILTENEYHSLLAVERRRRALEILEGTRRPVALEELASKIAASEDGVDVGDGRAFDRVAITLHHCHLPRLHDAGLVHYDPEDHWIDPTRLSDYRVEDRWTFAGDDG